MALAAIRHNSALHDPNRMNEAPANTTPWAEVFDSAIHGRGMKALRFIPAGTAVIQYVGELVPKEESDRRGVERCERSKVTGEAAVYIFELNEQWDLDGSAEHNIARREGKPIPCRRTFIVDNVITSGNTIRACSQALGFGTGLVFGDASYRPE